MGILFDLYKLKVKLFLGALRISKSSIVLLAVYALGMIPQTISMSMVVVDSVKKGIDLTVYLDALSAIISGFLVLVLLSTFKGFTAFEYEQNFIFTLPITPRYFLIASLLADITVFSLFFYPIFLFFGIIAISLNLSIMSVLSMVLILFLCVFFLTFLKSSISILESVYQNSQLNIVIAIIMVFLLFPAVGLFAYSPLKYSELPYPSTFLAQDILNILYNKLPPIHSFLGLASYFLASLALFLFASKKNLFQFTSSVPLVSPFDTSMRMQTVKMGKNIKLFSRAGLGITLNLGSESILRFLMKKEFIRMVRDGSLFAVALFYVIVSVTMIASSAGNMPVPMWIFLLAVYSFIVPSMLISNWRVIDLDNLWIPLTSQIRLKYIIRALLYDLTLISFTVPAVVIAAFTVLSRIDPLTPLALILSVSMIGCSTNLYVNVRFLGKGRRATPSLMISWVTLLLSGLLLTPTYVYVVLTFLWNVNVEVNLILSAIVLLYSALIFTYLSKITEKKTLTVEI